jgi:hypothetical protein
MRRGRAEREAAAVEVEADDLLHERQRRDEDGQVGMHLERGLEGRQRRVGRQDRMRREAPSRKQLQHDLARLGDEEPVALATIVRA